MNHAERPTAPRMILFSAPAFAIHAFGLSLSVYLPSYLSGATPLDIGAIGVAFMSVRVIDMALDPLIGVVIDSTKSRWGAYRPWLAASAPMLMLLVYGLFFVKHSLSMTMLSVWLAIGFVGYSIIVLSHLAWASTVGDTPDSRTRVFAWWQIFATLGQLAALSIPPIVIGLAGGSLTDAIHVVGYALLLIVPLCVMLCLASLPERRSVHAHGNSLANYLALLVQSRVWKILIVDFALGLSIGISNAISLFFFTKSLGLPMSYATSLILGQQVMALLGTPLFAKLAIRLGNARALAGGAGVFSCAQLTYLLVPHGSAIAAALPAMACGLCLPLCTLLPRVMMAEIAESERMATGANRSGILYAMLNGTMKAAMGLSVGIAFGLLSLVGFKAAAPVTADGALALRALIAVGPGGLLLFTALVMRTYYRRPEADHGTDHRP